MKTAEEIKRGLECCTDDDGGLACCVECPYADGCGCATDTDVLDLDALEYIRQLEDQLREVTEKVPQWHSADTPPKEYGRYITAMPRFGIDIADYIEAARIWWYNGANVDVSHWMPLPEAPKEVQHERL